MTNYARSAEVHRCVRSVFSPWCKAESFTRVPGGRCAFFKRSQTDPTALLAFEVQCSSFSNAQLGGRLTLNAAVGAIDVKYLSGRNARILRFASPELLTQASRLQAAVIARNVGVPIVHSPWAPNADNWCSYFDLSDVQAWAELLLPHLPALLASLLAASGQDAISW